VLLKFLHCAKKRIKSFTITICREKDRSEEEIKANSLAARVVDMCGILRLGKDLRAASTYTSLYIRGTVTMLDSQTATQLAPDRQGYWGQRWKALL